ncbi:AMP-binding enzyme [Actinomadura atramentaria]|uniref:AMP-binding enzyme n=1 Tax=Actinomadura atramentaria TaxID=1990 RepID=UPI000475D88A|nr:hypothetical protein [Actinomadura atramentaria]
MSYEDVETELRAHPRVEDCAVVGIPAGERRPTLVAYVVADGPVDAAEIRAFLGRPRLPRRRIPRAVILVKSLPRDANGRLRRKRLPLPVLSDRERGKAEVFADMSDGVLALCVLGAALVLTLVSRGLTDAFWPGSTFLGGVPQPWATLFQVLYWAESAAFGVGVAYLFMGYSRLERLGRPAWLTALAHVALAWLLIAWWPQDNFYRLTAKTDWGGQAACVYAFNITLMIAAAVLIAFAFADPERERERADDD